MKFVPPVDLSDFKLTVPLPCPTGKPLRVGMGGADRPWCVAQHVGLLPQSGDIHVPYAGVTGNLGGRIAGDYVRDIGYQSAEARLYSQMDLTLPHPRSHAWTNALAGRRNVWQLKHAVVLGKTLDPYQLDAVNRVTDAGAVIALAVGLGKTLIALRAALSLYNTLIGYYTTKPLVCGNVVAVCPLNAMPVWKDPDVVKWVNDHIGTYTVISSDSLHKIQALQNMGPSILIVDEAHYFGSVNAERTRLIHKLRWQFDACLPLTGSMLHAGPEKVLSLLDLAVPGAALYGNVYEFGQAFECMYSKDIGGGVMKKTVGKPPEKYREQFQKYLDRFVIAKTKRSPDVMVSLYVPEQELNDVLLYDPAGPSMMDEAGLMALELFKQTKTMPNMMDVMHALSRAGIADKLEWLAEVMNGFTDQLVLFGTYHESLDATEAWLKAEGLNYCRIDGAVTGPQRTTLIDGFRGGLYQVMLAQTDAASVSMNLQTASISVMLDTTQKAAAFEQALGRTCRRGSTHLCHHFNLAANKFQQFVFNRLKNAMDFNASVAEWQDAKRVIEQSMLAQTQGVSP